jgi:hypothetical protein
MSSPTTDPRIRQAFITGLRDLAGYLARHPAVPVPRFGTQILLCANSTDDGGCAQVDHFARQLGTASADSIADNGHYAAARSFGPVGYQMVAISEARMARYYAEISYAGCVTPDTTGRDSHAR